MKPKHSKTSSFKKKQKQKTTHTQKEVSFCKIVRNLCLFSFPHFLETPRTYLYTKKRGKNWSSLASSLRKHSLLG